MQKQLTDDILSANGYQRGCRMETEEGKLTRKFKRVKDYVQNQLQSLSGGARLPTIRTIMDQTGTGQVMVSKILRSLAEDGVIRIVPGQGIYRARQAVKSDEIRLLHWLLNPADSSTFFGILFSELQKMAQKAKRKITIESAGNRTPGKLARELADSGISNVIVVGASLPDFARELQDRMKVCLELLPLHVECVIPELRDSPDMTMRQMDYLLKRGYRRIGYLHYGGSDMYQYPIQLHRLLDYYRLMAENGLRVNPDWVFYCAEKYENLESGMEQILASAPKPEVLLVPGGVLPSLYSLCRKRKIKIGKDLALFSCDEINGDLSPEPTAITNNPAEIAQTFWQMFQAAERGEKVESAYTKLFIRTGQTVPDLKTAVR